jgi:ubiquinone/menaquinone biosynthesis C-methylase UbiE
MKTVYSKTIGYSPLENVELGKMENVIKVCRIIMNDYYQIRQNDKILVAGTGEGTETELISKEFNLFTTGIDLNISIHGKGNNKNTSLSIQNLGYLAFLDNTFSIIYSYHVLEHVNDHLLVLSELNRVLKPDGVLFIGFPNKHRIISYIGTSQKATIWEKMSWNFNDYRDRLVGRFNNESGAHAGFTEDEYLKSASRMFKSVIPVRNKYLLYKYKQLQLLIRLIIQSGFSEFIFPSNYFICLK